MNGDIFGHPNAEMSPLFTAPSISHMPPSQPRSRSRTKRLLVTASTLGVLSVVAWWNFYLYGVMGEFYRCDRERAITTADQAIEFARAFLLKNLKKPPSPAEPFYDLFQTNQSFLGGPGRGVRVGWTTSQRDVPYSIFFHGRIWTVEFFTSDQFNRRCCGFVEVTNCGVLTDFLDPDAI